MEHVISCLNLDLASVAEEVNPSLVQVRNGRRGTGAGIVWHPQGLVITNAHVAYQGPLKVVLADGRTLSAQIMAIDRDCDLAALHVETTDLPVVRLANSRAVRPGQWVTALGHPWGVTGAATSGIVIGTDTKRPGISGAKHDWLIVSLHMRPGYSGGPLVDVGGRLLGVNTMVNGPDVGFAIPVHEVVAFLRRELL